MVSNARNGRPAGAVHVLYGDESMLISDHGTLLRTRLAALPSLGRNTQGVRDPREQRHASTPTSTGHSPSFARHAARHDSPAGPVATSRT
ncbi:hypothetical protein B1218_38195 [Pseudomonas ogarae]|nr:hypothetical protein B1218_38195 [Pseudomonas ogarae]